MSTLKAKRYLKVIFNKFKASVVDISAPYLLPSVKLFTSYYNDGSHCYCMACAKENSYRITYGGSMVADTIGLPKELDLDLMKKYFEISHKVFRGIYYHEIGHLKYTAMHCTLIRDYPKYSSALHNLFNIMEDIVIERYCMSVNYKYTRKYFELLESLMFNEDAASKYVDTNDCTSFFNWLLLKLRMRKAFTGTNKFVDEHPDYINYVKDVMTEPKGEERIKKTIVFFEWLIEQGMDFSSFDMPWQSQLPFSRGEDSSSEMSSEGAEESSESFESGEYSTGPGEGVGEPTDTESRPMRKPSKPSEDEINPELDPSLDENTLMDSCIDALHSGDYSHSFYAVKDYFTPDDGAEEFVDNICEKVSTVATQVATKIKTFKLRIKPRYQKGYASGRLHIPSAIEGKPVNIFQRKEEVGLKTDLAVYLLIDNSGSMGTIKARLATEASLAMSLACDKAHIPFTVSMFTSTFDDVGSECVTYRIKTFKDDFSKVKKFFGVTDHEGLTKYDFDRLSLPTFCGNIDEINLYNIAQEYRKEKYHDKVLIVISDGGTCGSRETLTELVKQLERDFYIIGIGACTSYPASIYTHSKIFRDTTELVGLPEYIGDVLLDLSKGKRGK